MFFSRLNWLFALPDVDGEGDVDVGLGADGGVDDGVALAGHGEEAPLP